MMRLENLDTGYSLPSGTFSRTVYRFGITLPSPFSVDAFEKALTEPFERIVKILNEHYTPDLFGKKEESAVHDRGISVGFDYFPLDGKTGGVFVVSPKRNIRFEHGRPTDANVTLHHYDSLVPSRMEVVYAQILALENLDFSPQAMEMADRMALIRSGVHGDDLVRKLLAS